MGLSYKKMSELEMSAALDVARAEPSYRGQCQALAWIARYMRDQKNVRRTAEAAIDAAARDEDLYTAVFPLAWPIRALLERGEQKIAAETLERALNKSDGINPASSRSEAVFLLFQAAMHGPDRLWVPAFEKLAAASLPLDHWRQRRNLRDALLMIVAIDYFYAKTFVDTHGDDKLKKDFMDRLKSKNFQSPRPFFW
jgi:hypothetical protein